METNVIEYLETKRHVSTVESVDRYVFRKDKGYHGLQRLLFWVLAKIGCYAQDERIAYTQHRLDTDDLMEAIYKQDIGVLEFYNQRGKSLLIGSKDYQELTGNPAIRQMMQFTGKYRGGYGEVLGMNIIVIPWMKGMLVVPKNVA